MTSQNLDRIIKEAEVLGFKKFRSDKGEIMIVCTQEEFDAVIKQQISKKPENSY